MKTIAYLVVLLALVGCTPLSKVVVPPTNGTNPEKGDYLIGVGDQLSIKVWRNPELSIAVPVRPDGRISTPLVGDIIALDKTPEELAEVVKAKLQKYVRNPEVTVIVVGPRGEEYTDRVRVIGAVAAPRSLPYQEGMTVLDLVLEAGGVTEFAAGNRALLYRADENGQKKAYPLHLDEILLKGNMATNFPLQPLDVITVPERVF